MSIRVARTREEPNILVIGAGVVGKATGIGFSGLGINVIFNDIKKEVCEGLRCEGYQVVEDLTEAVSKSKVSFICIQTPTRNSRIDLSYVKRVANDLGKAISSSEGYHVVVVRSTVLPSTTRSKIIPILEENSGLKAGKDFGVCANPEFLREVNAISDFLNPSRIIIGQLDERSGNVLEGLYRKFNAPIFKIDLEMAEMIKYVANSFLATKISFFNDIYLICKRLGLNPVKVAEIVALDPRIDNYGIKGGRPFGGSCLPKDLESFISFIHDQKMNPKILSATLQVNETMKKNLIESIE